MADRLDTAIAAKQKLVSDLQGQLAQAQSELHVLRSVAADHPPVALNGAGSNRPTLELGPEPPTRSRGRQKGSISHKWRKTFAFMYRSGHANPPEEIQVFAEKAGINITVKSAKTRALEYVKAGFLEARPNGFWVREETIRKFNLKKV
jgi:hypothetical protein